MKWLWRTLGVVAAVLVIAYLAFRTPDTDLAEMRAKYGGPPSQFVHVGGGQIFHVRDEGPRGAPPIVLLHGSNSDLHTWDEWAAGLRQDYRVVRFDQVGHGLTGPDPARDYSRANYTEDIRALTRRLGLTRFVLGGNSMGGKHALAFAAAYPEKVAALVLVDAAGGPVIDDPNRDRDTGNIGFTIARTAVLNSIAEQVTPRWLIEQSLRQSVADEAVVTEAMVDRYWELLCYPGNRRATLDRFALDYDPLTRAEIEGIAVPALILWGEEDRLIPLAAGEWLDRALPDSTLIAYRGVGHLPQKEAPRATLEDLRRWLAGLAPAL